MLAVFPALGFRIFHHKKYETPITKETLQPDKVLFDKAIKNIEHGDYEAARLTLNTLINTYDTSEYLAKAKLAIADSWFREGGAHGLAQAEAEYKDFILFYPNMEEAAESQFKVCNIHFKQMEKADRDNTQGAARGRRMPPGDGAVPELEVRAAGASRCCAKCRKFWPTRNSAPVCSTATRAAFPPPPAACRLSRSNIRCTAARMKRCG